LLLYRSGLGLSGMVLYFYAIDNSVLADANMLNKISTFFLILFSFVFLKERIKRYQTISIIVAFIGTLFIIKPAFQIEIIPYIAAIFSAIFAGASYTLLRYLGDKEKFFTITFFFSLFSVVTLFPFFIYYFEPMTTTQLIYLLLAGTFASIGQYGITIAYRYAPAREISIFNYLNVVFVTIISFFVFTELPDIYSFIGYFIIFGSSFYIFCKTQKEV
jgi:drug/metabolite transporter (DMT)-like permease